MIDLSVGEAAVRIARSAARSAAAGEDYVLPDGLPEAFGVESGAFVTICTYPDRDLRACIGYPGPYMPLGRTVVDAARGAVYDPRFPVLTVQEADECVFEVTVLTPPAEMSCTSPEDILDSIVIGRDGLMIEYGGCRGLFLPQVPVEQGWDKEQYLDQLCRKAGLSRSVWRSGRALLHTFSGEIFEEMSPGGIIVRRD